MIEHKKKRFLKDWNTYFVIIIILFLLCSMVVFACFKYYAKLQDTVKTESGSYLQEISKQIGVNAGKTIDDNFTILNTIATVIKTTEIKNFDRLEAVLQEQQKNWNFEHVLLVNEDGIAYDAYGHTELLGSADYLKQVVVDRERSMSTSQMMNGTECVVFAIPLEGIEVENTKMSALVATYNLATFDKLLSMTAFEGTGYGHIIKRDGTVVIRSSSPYALQTGYNILNSFSQAHFMDGAGVKTVSADIANGLSGQVEFDMGGEPLYMSYTPLKTREWYLLTFVPVAVANAKSTLLFKITLLICTLVTLVFFILLLVITFISYRHKIKLEKLAYVDRVTGGNTMQYFYNEVAVLIAEPNVPQYALVYTNIKKFKLLNEQLGRTACDDILRAISNSIQKDLDSCECMGRSFADNFCVLLQYKGEKNLAKRLETWNDNYNKFWEKGSKAWLPLNVEVGVYVIEDLALPLPDMIDRAQIALRETSRELDAQLHYMIYDENVRCRLLREKQLEDMMEKALDNHEFEVYLQPKYCTNSEKIGGAEALVRWINPKEGMIYPDEFISLFEKNGFIVQLDLWVFEQVCITLRKWLDKGINPIGISVNCSRVHLKTPEFLRRYADILHKYKVNPNLLEIELTENVVFEDVVHLTKTISEIHGLGLKCSMDDFGSGYSSLNLIQDIPVDVLKLDKIFFHSGNVNLARTESVVGSIITMAGALSMETVAEGVEELYHVEMLKRLGCDYIQGYYFAKPMPIEDFEILTFGQVVKAE